MQQSRFKKCKRNWYIIIGEIGDLAGLKSDADNLDIDKSSKSAN